MFTGRYTKFLSVRSRGCRTGMGSLHAADDRMALENARDAYTRRSEGCSIWVVKASEIVASQPEESGEFFDPAESKVYRHPTFYTIPDGIEHM